jgi:hypothetical protein
VSQLSQVFLHCIWHCLETPWRWFSSSWSCLCRCQLLCPSHRSCVRSRSNGIWMLQSTPPGSTTGWWLARSALLSEEGYGLASFTTQASSPAEVGWDILLFFCCLVSLWPCLERLSPGFVLDKKYF